MGKTLDALLGRNLKASKLKTLAKLAICRISILKKKREIRYSHAHSDVKQLLQLGQQEPALLRVGHVIMEQNMLQAYVMIESYCHLLIEKEKLIQKNKECPEELKEAVSSLIHAASRCGEFPELQEIRRKLTSMCGKEFSAGAVELRNNCGVNPKLVEKLSTQQPVLNNRLKLLKEIASENDIALHLADVAPVTTKQGKLEGNRMPKQFEPIKSADLVEQEHKHDSYYLPKEINIDRILSTESMKGRKKYRDIAAAAQEAYESAAYAAAAARAAVELSISESQGCDPDDHNGSDDGETMSGLCGSSTIKIQSNSHVASRDKMLGFDKDPSH